MPGPAMSEWRNMYQSRATPQVSLHLPRRLLGRELRTDTGRSSTQVQYGSVGRHSRLPFNHTK